MKKYLFILLVLPLIWVGCEEVEITDRKPVIRTYEQGDFRFSYWLETSEGEVATIFKENEDIVVHYTAENLSSDSVAVNYDASDVTAQDNFSRVFRTSDDMDLGRPSTVGPAIIVGCIHYAPGVIFNFSLSYPSDDSYSLNYLKKGKYYVKFKPMFAYYKEPYTNQVEGTSSSVSSHDVHLTEPCIHEKEGASSYYIDIPEFRIDFKVK